MKIVRSALLFSIVGAALVLPTIATAQDPKNPQLPDSTDAPPSRVAADRESDRARLLEAQREIELLEARLAVRKAEIEEILARDRLRQAREKLSAISADARKYQLAQDDANRPSVPFPDTQPGPRVLTEQERQIKKAIIAAVDAKNRPILDALDQKVVMAFPDKTPLEDVLKYVRTASKSEELPNGIPIAVDPIGVPDAELTMRMMVTIKTDDLPLKASLSAVLRQVRLTWTVTNGVLVISTPERNGTK